MKRLEISRLMDEYQDNEFCPEGGSIAEPEAVKRRVLAKARVLAQKKRTTGKKKLLLAAGLAAVMVVLVGAGFPSMVYRLVSGTLAFEQTPDSRKIIYEGSSFLELEDGRLFFALEGERTDITDLISADAPYIYDGSDPETGMVYYVIMGGTPEQYGWLEWIKVPNPFGDGEIVDEEGRLCTYHFNCVTYNEQGERNAYATGGAGMDALDWQDAKDFPWLIAAAEELHIPFVDSESGNADIFYAPF